MNPITDCYGAQPPDSPPEFAKTLTDEWMPLCAQNKNGNGTGTGEIPEAALAIVGK